MAAARSIGELSRLDPCRVLLVGDAHGDAAFIARAAAQARRSGCAVLVQLGDFGFWAHTRDGVAFLDVCAELLGEDLTLVFVDGNHENHDLLGAWHDAAGRPEVLEVAPQLWHVRRGCRWVWQGRRFGALGGAASVDRIWRDVGVSWWSAEVLTDSDVERLGDGPLDVLVCHDAPSGAPFDSTLTFPDSDRRRADASRALLDRAVAATKPQLVVHGHWHRRRSWEPAGPGLARIESLGANVGRFDEAVAVLDVATLELSPVS